MKFTKIICVAGTLLSVALASAAETEKVVGRDLQLYAGYYYGIRCKKGVMYESDEQDTWSEKPKPTSCSKFFDSAVSKTLGHVVCRHELTHKNTTIPTDGSFGGKDNIKVTAMNKNKENRYKDACALLLTWKENGKNTKLTIKPQVTTTITNQNGNELNEGNWRMPGESSPIPFDSCDCYEADPTAAPTSAPVATKKVGKRTVATKLAGTAEPTAEPRQNKVRLPEPTLSKAAKKARRRKKKGCKCNWRRGCSCGF